MMKALEATGTKDYRGQQVRVGEVIAYRNLFWSLSEAMARDASPWVNGAVLPNYEASTAYHVFGATFYPIDQESDRTKRGERIDLLNSSARDFKIPELRPISRQVRARIQRIRCRTTRKADEAPVGFDRQRVRRAARIVRDQLLGVDGRKSRHVPEYRERNGIDRAHERSRRQMHGRIRHQRLDRSRI